MASALDLVPWQLHTLAGWASHGWPTFSVCFTRHGQCCADFQAILERLNCSFVTKCNLQFLIRSVRVLCWFGGMWLVATDGFRYQQGWAINSWPQVDQFSMILVCITHSTCVLISMWLGLPAAQQAFQFCVSFRPWKAICLITMCVKARNINQYMLHFLDYHHGILPDCSLSQSLNMSLGGNLKAMNFGKSPMVLETPEVLKIVFHEPVFPIASPGISVGLCTVGFLHFKMDGERQSS